MSHERIETDLAEVYRQAEINVDADNADACRNCKGAGRVPDLRTASITHRVTTIRRKCRCCQGTGRMPQPVTVPEEPEIGEIPDWMLGLED